MVKSLKILSVLAINLLLFFFVENSVYATINFSINNPVINGNDEIEVDATISGLISSSCSVTGCYLQGELQSGGGYFGYTYNNSGEYVDFFKSPSTIDEIKSKLWNFIPVSGGWTGKLKVKNNSLSCNYYGPGEYLLSFRRFSGNSLTPTGGDSNSIAVTLNMPLVTPTSEPTIPPSSTPTATPTPFILRTPDSTPFYTSTPKTISTASLKKEMPTPEPKSTSPSGSEAVLSVATEITITPLPTSILEQNSKIKLPILPIVLIILGICFIGASIFSIIRNGKKDSEIP